MSKGIPQITLSELDSHGIKLLDEAGCLVVHGVTSQQQRDALRVQMAGVMETTPVRPSDDDEGQFYPGNTRRGTSLVAHSPMAREFVMHPMSIAVCDHFLQPNCPDCRYQLHVTAAVEIGPGARKQVLHREDDPFSQFPLPRPNLIVASMWAITDFRADNGGTLLVPGSHKWGPERQAEPGEIFSAEMPAGSVLLWLGSTLHGGGANVSQDWRYGVILTYSVGWVRQEENQSLATPPEIAETFSAELQDMLGNTMNGALGFHFYHGVDEQALNQMG